MKRDLQALAASPFDVLVIGAGIQGACIAWSAARSGFRTALIDRDDFGAAASANSLKIIHGGLRYLQHGDLRRMRESIRARRRFLHLAPGNVRPLDCLMASRGGGTRSRAAFRIAIALNAVISADRNRDLAAGSRLPAGSVLSREALAARVPGFRIPDGTTGAMLWHDALADDTDRLNIGFVLAAAKAGASVANYVRADRLLEADGQTVGVEATDLETGASFPIRAAQTVLAAGPGGEGGLGSAPRTWLLSCNLILRRPLVTDAAVAIESREAFDDADALIRRGRRNFFVVPWRGGTMIGTSYTPWPAGRPPRLDRAGLEEFVRQVNEIGAFPPVGIDEIVRVHAGVLPAGGDRLSPAKETGFSTQRGLVRVQAVKYTTAPEVADQVVRHLRGGQPPPADEPLPPPPPADEPIESAVRRAVREEMALHLPDLVARRTRWADFGLPDAAMREQAATAMAALCGWDEARRRRELDATREAFAVGLP